jgi:hypothetical protein
MVEQKKILSCEYVEIVQGVQNSVTFRANGGWSILTFIQN